MVHGASVQSSHAPNPAGFSNATQATTVGLPLDRLWAEAYEQLKVEERDMVARFAQFLTGAVGTTPNAEQIAQGIKRRLEKRESHKLMVTFSGKSTIIREQWEKLVKFVLGCEDMISTVAALEPHAAIAWAGVSLILPVSSNNTGDTKIVIGL